MESRHFKGHDAATLALALTCILGPAPCGPNRPGRLAPPLILVDRAVTQDQESWVIDYRLKNATRARVTATPDGIGLKVEGGVANSRVASHSVPRCSFLVVSARAELTAFSDVNRVVDESARCRACLVNLASMLERFDLAGSVGPGMWTVSEASFFMPGRQPLCFSKEGVFRS